MSQQKLKLIQQGAEAKILLDETKKQIIKDRIPKSYRIKELDDKIRKRRTKSEVKLLLKAGQIINVPQPVTNNSASQDELSTINNKPLKKEVISNNSFMPKENNFQIVMPFIDGKKLSQHLDEFPLAKQKQILKQIGEDIAKLHDADIIHGDLTTSNMILVDDCTSNKGDKINIDNKENLNKQISKLKRGNKISLKEKEVISNNISLDWVGGNNQSLKIFFIDFGLGFFNGKFEDKAVDIHLLKQALEAKHFQHWQELYNSFLEGYKSSKNYDKTLNQLNKVEKRGRYRH